MGFPDAWISLIDRCIGSCWFSVLINGAPSGFFKSSRGLRQGDPISPALFVIAAEYLSKALDKLILGKREMTFKAARRCMEISHLAYADDIIIFMQAAASSLSQLRACLNEYEAISGQQINLGKSNFYIAEAHVDWTSPIQLEGGFSPGSFPFLYLGVPIYRGTKRTEMFMFLRDKIANRISGWAHRHLSFGGRLTLIKSTLEAVPIHIFQAIEPTVSALKLLDQILARFFWGSTNERKRTHWISWNQICLPTSEGGLGIRNFKEVLRAFTIKLWWRFREQNSLWARYLMSKYCSNSSPTTRGPTGRASPTWRRILRARPHAQPHIRWIIGKGSISFWDDIWIGNSSLRELCLDDRGSPQALVSDYISGGDWDVPKLQQLHDQAGLPHHIITMIRDTPIITDDPDIPRWTLSKLGDFSVSSTWDTIRSRRPLIPSLADIWKAGLTSSIAIFAWRLLSNRIPVDTKLQWRKIELASKCLCCLHRPGIESLQHLFIQGTGASRVWREFDGWFEGDSPSLQINDTIPDRLAVWSQRVQHTSRKHLSRSMPLLILWFLWAERNRCRHQETQFKAYNVIWQVQMFIRNSMANGGLKPKHWKDVKLGFCCPRQEEARRPIPRAMVVKWNPPDQPWLKLNTDGAYSETSGRAGGGGILRNHCGNLIAAFTTPLDAQSALEAELLAIHHGLTLAWEFVQPIWVESDAAQAISLIKGASWGPAQSRRAMAHLALHRRHGNFRISYTPREGNKAADHLAKMGLEIEEFTRFNDQSAPRLLKAIVRMEEMGIPNIRVYEDDPD